MRKIKVIISVLLTISMVLTGSFTVFGAENSTDYLSEENNSKIDSILEKVLAEANNNDIIPVSIWFTDISHEIIKDKVEEEMTSDIESGRISQEAIDLVFFDDLKSDVLESQPDSTVYDDCKELAESVSTEQAMEIISCERRISSELYSKRNSEHISDIMRLLSLSDEEISSSLLYSCKYAPNIDICLTKEQIFSVVENVDISCIYYLDPDIKICSNSNTDEDIEENDGLRNDSEEIFDTTFYNVTGINTARDAWRLNGYGMKVGMLEYDGIIDTSKISTHTSQIHKVSTTPYSESDHANTVAKLMVGYLDGYIGAIPNADLYYDSFDSNDNNNNYSIIKQRIEELIDEKVTAINCSFCVYSYSTFNTYGDLAKWYDHVSVQHNVHLIIASGNFGSTGVPFSNMSYNAVVVGNCYNDGLIRHTSSYCNSAPSPYKPDLVAPGVNIHVIPNYTASGTSFSAPLVTAAVIQLSQCSAILLSNPRLMKSLLISSTKITNGMSNDPMYSIVGDDDIAYSRRYGAGLLYVPNAYVAFHDKGYYQTGLLSKYGSSVIFQKYLKRTVGKTVRVCLTWDKLCTLDEPHSSSSVNENQLDTILLKVTTPDGVEYTSAYEYDNKQMVTFIPQANGYYQFELYRITDVISTNNKVNYAVTWSVQP